MTESYLQIPFLPKEKDWLIDQARKVTNSKEVEQDKLLAKLRDFSEKPYRFLYQKELQLKVGEIASYFFDKERELSPGHHEMATTALSYFMDEVDIIPDHHPFAGYLDDYIIIYIIYETLGLPAPEIFT